MDSELKTKWVSALRSGEYEQGHEALFKDGAYCCLGVLCKISGADMSGQKRTGLDDEGDEMFVVPTAWLDENHYTEDEELMGLLGYFDIGSAVEGKLIALNDSERADFKQIADWIEGHDIKTGLPVPATPNT